MDLMHIKERAQALLPETIKTRRALHRIPEIGFAEVKTHAYICDALQSLGVPFETERTWVIGTIEGAKPGGTVALRADMDALPIQEEAKVPFKSEHPGFMHACGHDAHTAILLTAAKMLMEMRAELPGTVRLLFQPAEETVGGAAPMIAHGAMEGVDRVYGLHVAATAPVGRIACREGAMYAASEEFAITVRGRSGHGAHPRSGVDAIAIAAQIIVALQTLITREMEATEAAIISVGTIHGGDAHNILCDEVVMNGTIRALTETVHEQLRRRMPELVGAMASAMGGEADVSFMNGYCACINDAGEASRVLDVASRLFGEENTYVLRNSSLGAEDFAYYLREAPGAIYHLGCGGKYPVHSAHFAMDESCLAAGVAMQVALVMDYLGETGDGGTVSGGQLL